MLKLAHRAWLTALAALAIAVAPGVAQEKLAEGTWTGTAVAPDGEVVDLDYEVAYMDDALEITLLLPPETGRDELVVSEVMHEGDVLSFLLPLGEAIACQLVEQDDGRYEGECTDSMGDSGILTMFPPGEGR